MTFAVVDNESPTFTDLTGDGRPELVLQHRRPDSATPRFRRTIRRKPWTFHAISAEPRTTSGSRTAWASAT